MSSCAATEAPDVGGSTSMRASRSAMFVVVVVTADVVTAVT